MAGNSPVKGCGILCLFAEKKAAPQSVEDGGRCGMCYCNHSLLGSSTILERQLRLRHVWFAIDPDKKHVTRHGAKR